jgi:hypothetical protein
VTVVLADLAAPGATRLGVRSGLGLVVAGLRTRHRMAPPLHVRLGFLLLDRPTKLEHRPWVEDMIRMRLDTRQLGAGLFFLALWTVPGLLPGGRPLLPQPFLVWFGVVVLLGTFSATRRRQDRMALRHLLPPYVLGSVRRQRLEARSGARLMLAVVASGTLMLGADRVATGLVDVPTTVWSLSEDDAPVALPLVVLVVAAVLGTAVALFALRQLRRGLDRLPEQPARLVVPVTRRQRIDASMQVGMAAVLSVGMVAWGAWWVNDLLLTACLLVRPWALAAWGRARGALPDGLALVDLGNLTGDRAGAIAADQPVEAAVIRQSGGSVEAIPWSSAPAASAAAAPAIVVGPFGPGGPAPA